MEKHTHKPKTSKEVPFSHAVASPENARAHGGVCIVDTCRCGAVRRTNRNAGQIERGPWVDARPTLTCPLCGGNGKSAGNFVGHAEGVCPECHGTGRVINHFALAGPGRSETARETAEAECRPLAEVQRERRRAKQWIRRHVTTDEASS